MAHTRTYITNYSVTKQRVGRERERTGQRTLRLLISFRKYTLPSALRSGWGNVANPSAAINTLAMTSIAASLTTVRYLVPGTALGATVVEARDGACAVSVLGLAVPVVVERRLATEPAEDVAGDGDPVAGDAGLWEGFREAPLDSALVRRMREEM